MRQLGRTLEILGLILLPVGMAMQLTGVSVRNMLLLMVLGFSLFYIGRLLEGWSG